MRSAAGCERVSVLDRILSVLNAVRAAGGTSTIAQIAIATRLPKSTVSRIVGELVRQRYLSRTGRDVGIGMRLFEFGASAATPRRLRAAAMPVLAELFNATGEHLNVAVREGRDMLSVVSVQGRLRPSPSRAGARVPSATTALGKAALAFADDEIAWQRAVADVDDEHRDALERELPGIRADGVALDSCDTFPGVVAIASPVLSPDHVAVAAISVAGPVGDMNPNRLAPLVRHAALVLARRLASAAG